MKKVIISALAFAPTLTFAQANLSGISNLVSQVGGIIAKIIPIFFAIAIIYFFWGVVDFLRGSGDDDKLKAGKEHMLWGLIGLFVMISIYGIIAWVQSTLNISAGGTVVLPQVPGLQ